MGAVRIGRVRLKAGGAMLRLATPAQDEGRERVLREVRACLECQRDVVGFAFVVWGEDHGSTAEQWSGPGSEIPNILIPDYVRNRLLALQIERWTLGTLRENGVIG